MSIGTSDLGSHYKHGECETKDFISEVLCRLSLEPDQYWAVGSILKYACRAGFKEDWVDDARKCADYITLLMTGEFIGGGASEGASDSGRFKLGEEWLYVAFNDDCK